MSVKRCIVLMVGLSSTATAQDQPRVIRGTIRDSLGARIERAVVQTTGQSRVVSDDSGHFEYRATPRGELRLLVRRLGYSPLELRINPIGDTTIAILLAPIPRRFDPMNVVASAVSGRLRGVGFYDRMNDRNKGIGSGLFVTAEDIEQRNPLRISQMLDQMTGVRVQKIGAGFNDFEIRGPNRCKFTVYLNGTRIGPKGPRPDIDVVKIDEWVEPSATAGIEVYPRATSAPPHLQMLNGTCGVVAFWTK